MNGFFTEGKEKLLDDQKEALVLARSIQVFAGLKCPERRTVVQIQKAFRKQGREKDRNKGRNKTEIKTEAEMQQRRKQKRKQKQK